MLVELNEKEFSTLKRVLEAVGSKKTLNDEELNKEYEKYKNDIPSKVIWKIDRNLEHCNETVYKELVVELAKNKVELGTNFNTNNLTFQAEYEEAFDKKMWFELVQGAREWATGLETYIYIIYEYEDSKYKSHRRTYDVKTVKSTMNFLNKFKLIKNLSKAEIRKLNRIEKIKSELTRWAFDNVEHAPDWTSEIVDDFMAEIKQTDLDSMSPKKLIAKYGEQLDDFIQQAR